MIEKHIFNQSVTQATKKFFCQMCTKTNYHLTALGRMLLDCPNNII